MAPHASSLVQWGIGGIALVVVALVGVGVAHIAGMKRGLVFAAAASTWLGLTGALGYAGFFTDFESRPPHMILLMLPTLLLPIALALSSWGAALAEAPLALLIGFQAFRLPLELVMHQAAVEAVMPPQMTYTGRNFDIVSGATALLVALWVARFRAPGWLVLAWNALGSLLLLNILIVAVASLPLFSAFGRDAAHVNTWVAHFPFVWLPAGLVSAAVLGHALLWRRLLSHGMRARDGSAAFQGDRGRRLFRHG